MARRRRHHKRGHHKNSFMSMINKFITPAAFLATVPQIAGKDIAFAGAGYTNLPPLEKLKFLSNSAIGRMTGFNPFPTYGQHQITMNPSGIANKYTYTGLALTLYAKAGAPLGYGGLARKVGKGLLTGGVVFGFFDDPASLPPTPQQQVGSVYAQTGSNYPARVSMADAGIISAAI